MAMLLGAATGSVAAHDFWIEPEFVDRGTTPVVLLRAYIGHPSDKEEFPADPTHWETYSGSHTHEGVQIAGTIFKINKPGHYPLAMFDPAGKAQLSFHYQSKGINVSLDPTSFENYLKDEGFSEAIQLRKKLNESNKEGREFYRRYCVTRTITGKLKTKPDPDGEGEYYHQFLPPPMTGKGPEFIGSLDTRRLLFPTSHKTDEKPAWVEIDIVLNHKSGKISNQRIKAISLDESDNTFEQVTDNEGRVTFQLPTDRRWLFRTVMMKRAENAGKEGSTHDWESHWFTLTLDLPAFMNAAESN
jgi:hypothetical protein